MREIAQQQSFDWTEPETYHSDRFGFFALLVRDAERAAQRAEQMRLDGYPPDKIKALGTTVQRMHRLDQLPFVLDNLDPGRDSWISQAEFGLPRRPDGSYGRPNRRAVNMLRVGLLFIDLDCRDLKSASQIDKRTREVLAFCDAFSIPRPSFVVFSGQGLHLKWITEHMLPRSAVPRWNALQLALVTAFKDAGWPVDVGARDISRVLRLENTINSKSGEVCRVVWCDAVESDIRRVSFDGMASQVLPLGRDKRLSGAESAAMAEMIREDWEAEQRPIFETEERPALRLVRSGNPIGRPRSLNKMQLGWDRLHDMRLLAELRTPAFLAGDRKGRENLVFWSVVMCLHSGVTTPNQMMREALAIAREVGGVRWAEGKNWNSLLSSLRKRAESDRALIFTPKNDTLIEKLEISDDEQKQLKTVISHREKRERARPKERAKKRAERRAEGAIPRDEYEARAQDRKKRAQTLHAEGQSIRAIAEMIGVSKTQVGRWVK